MHTRRDFLKTMCGAAALALGPALIAGRLLALTRCLRRAGRQPLDHGQGEGRRLACSSRRLREQVPAGQDQGNRLALDRCRLFVAERRE